MQLTTINNRITTPLLLLIICVLSGGALFGQRAEINQLKIDLSETTNDSTKARIYNKIATVYRQIDMDSTLYYLDKSILLLKKSNVKGRLLGTYLTNKAAAYVDKGAYRQALETIEQTLSVSKKRNDSLSIALCHSITGIIYKETNEPEKALAAYQLTLDILSQMQDVDKMRKAEVLNNIGNVYFGLEEYDKALEYYEAFRKMILETQKMPLVALSTVAIGNVYVQQGRIDTAITLFSSVINTLDPEKDEYPALMSIGSAYDNMANAYYKQQRYEKALIWTKKSMAFFDKYQSKERSSLYSLLTKIAIGLKNYAAAINYAQKGIALAKSTNVRGGALPFYQLLSEAYEANNQLNAALVMERQYSQLKDSLNQLQVEEKIASLEFTAEIKQKEAENALLKEEKKNQNLNIQQKNYAIIAISLGLLSLGFILTQMYLARNKLKHLNQQLATQANELKQNQLFKNRLFGNIAHELRTPLTLITGQLDLISKESPVDLKVQQKIQIAKNTSQDLLGLTNQILDLTKSEVGLVKTAVSNFPLLDLVNYLQLQFEPIAQRKDIALQFTTTDEKIELSTDAEKLLTILRNLLSNALKYNQAQGRIKLDCKNSGTDVEIVVEDSGQGIPQADLSSIFDRYYQSQQTQTAEGGIGVGLAICKEYIQLLGGTIKVQSTLGKGSSFTIRFPQKMTTSTLNIPKYEFPKYLAATYPELPSLQTANETIEEYVLVVEDNLELSHYIYELLQKEHTVYFAANGHEALQQIELQAPIAIITDWMMPVMDGEALIKHLKNSKKFAAIPVLMLTARTDVKEQLAVLRIGLDDYLTKPFDATVLKAHLNHLIEQARQQLHVRKEDELMDQLETKLLAFDPKEQELLKQVEQIVLKNIASFDLTLEKISQIIGLSERHLSRKIKQLTKLTANQFVNEIRFQEAKRMLIEKEYSSVKAVVYSVGFKSEKGFSRNFKKRFGKYPKELLNKIG